MATTPRSQAVEIWTVVTGWILIVKIGSKGMVCSDSNSSCCQFNRVRRISKSVGNWPLQTHGVRPVSRRLKNKTVHTTFELWQAALQDPILALLMPGVYPRDKLPIVNKYPSGLIANTDPHDKPGTHWVATYFISLWEGDIFWQLRVFCWYLWHRWIHQPECDPLQW